MKKLFSLFLILLLCCTPSVFASERNDLIYEEAKLGLPKTYNPDEISLFSTAEAEMEKRIFEGWQNLSPDISVSDLKIPMEVAKELYINLIHENPMYFYVDTWYSYYYYTMGNIKYLYSFQPHYTETNPEKIKNLQQQIEIETEKILMTIDEDMTDYEKVIAVHDYMVLHYHYDNSLENHAITIMVNGYGVCESYVYAFLHVMNELGIDCTYVSSDVMNHAWNLVKIDNEWYHIDLTWDDPQNANHHEDNYAVVSHTYALLSTEKIMSLQRPHYGFDLGGLEANSTRFDNAVWHKDTGAIAHLDNMEYWVDGNNLVREDGKVIFEKLDGGDGIWNIAKYSGFRGMINVGLASYKGLLYFNNETAIYTYDPKKDKCTVFRTFTDENGGLLYLDGLYIDGNILRFSRYCPDNCGCNHFCEGGSIQLGKVSAKAGINKKGKVAVRILKEDDAPLLIFTFNGKQYDMQKAHGKGFQSLVFEADEEQTVFFWDEDLRPIQTKQSIRKPK